MYMRVILINSEFMEVIEFMWEKVFFLKGPKHDLKTKFIYESIE